MTPDLTDAELADFEKHLRRIHSTLPDGAKGFASNLIQQIHGYLGETEKQRAVILPLMLAQLVRFELARAIRQGDR
jgi:hypothetical protein